MPMVIPRTGTIAVPEIPPQAKNMIWERIVQNYAEAHPEIFTAAQQEDNHQFDD